MMELIIALLLVGDYVFTNRENVKFALTCAMLERKKK